ncbi:MAG TPA: hypothetical protein VLQ80_18055, partial [Candidatus Saccharimonadia bacterium]|nr:hypothetical protein [Candidatus Saccharimonadia bacterium]
MLLPTRGSYWIATLFIIMALCVAIPAHAQFIVHDPGNADINLITAIESAATTAQAVLQTANQLQELLPLDDIALAVDFLETVATVQAIVEEATALIGDVQTAEYQVRA